MPYLGEPVACYELTSCSYSENLERLYRELPIVGNPFACCKERTAAIVAAFSLPSILP